MLVCEQVVANMKLNLVLVSRTVLQLLLFCLFLGFFGIPSFSQYQKKETILVKSELDTDGIEAPAVTLMAVQNKFGWKSARNESFWYKFVLYEHCERINMTIEQCIHKDSIQLTDFLADARIEKTINSSSSVLLNLSSASAYWREDMTATAFGKYFTFKSPKSTALNQDYCMTFILVRNFTFVVFVHDEDFFLNNANPWGPPINYWTFEGPSQKNHYQELILTKHTKLNLDGRPCEEDPAYSFTKCIKENSSRKVIKMQPGLSDRNYEIIEMHALSLNEYTILGGL